MDAERHDVMKGRDEHAPGSRGRWCYVYPVSGWRSGLVLGSALKEGRSRPLLLEEPGGP